MSNSKSDPSQMGNLSTVSDEHGLKVRLPKTPDQRKVVYVNDVIVQESFRPTHDAISLLASLIVSVWAPLMVAEGCFQHGLIFLAFFIPFHFGFSISVAFIELCSGMRNFPGMEQESPLLAALPSIREVAFLLRTSSTTLRNSLTVAAAIRIIRYGAIPNTLSVENSAGKAETIDLGTNCSEELGNGSQACHYLTGYLLRTDPVFRQTLLLKVAGYDFFETYSFEACAFAACTMVFVAIFVFCPRPLHRASSILSLVAVLAFTVLLALATKNSGATFSKLLIRDSFHKNAIEIAFSAASCAVLATSIGSGILCEIGAIRQKNTLWWSMSAAITQLVLISIQAMMIAMLMNKEYDGVHKDPSGLRIVLWPLLNAMGTSHATWKMLVAVTGLLYAIPALISTAQLIAFYPLGGEIFSKKVGALLKTGLLLFVVVPLVLGGARLLYPLERVTVSVCIVSAFMHILIAIVTRQDVQVSRKTSMRRLVTVSIREALVLLILTILLLGWANWTAGSGGWLLTNFVHPIMALQWILLALALTLPLLGFAVNVYFSTI